MDRIASLDARQSSTATIRTVVTVNNPIDAEMKRNVGLKTREPSVGNVPPPCELRRAHLSQCYKECKAKSAGHLPPLCRPFC
jgi:hypothetical protein